MKSNQISSCRSEVEKGIATARAVFMTEEQVQELVEKARQDSELWEKLKIRELEGEDGHLKARAQGKWLDSPDVVLEPLLSPTWEELLIEFLRAQYGQNYYQFERMSLTMALRRKIGKELNLPV